MAPQVDANQRDLVLRALYASSSLIAVFQILWAGMKLPIESKLIMKSIPVDEADKKVGEVLAARFGSASEEGKIVAAKALTTKYFGEVFVFVTHILPAPLWSAIVPFQLHPASRGPALRKVHHALGRIFFSISAIMMVGFAAIMAKGLDIRPGAEWFKGVEGKKIRDMPGYLVGMIKASHPFLFSSAAWFCYTLYRAVDAAQNMRFAEHELWVMRHIASGQWVGLMRIFLGKGFPLGIKKYGDTQDVISSVFVSSALGAWLCCVSGAEIAVLRVKAHRAALVAARAAARAARNAAKA